VTLGGLRFGDHFVEQLVALTIGHADLGSAGIIGLDGLKDKRLTLNFTERRMDVGKSRSAPMRNTDPNTIVVEARSRLGQLILVDSRIDGQKVNVILDTGAEMSVGNMALFNRLKLKRLVIPPTPTTLTSVTGISVPALFTIVRRMTIGSMTLENMPMVFLDAEPFNALDLGDKPAMLLGMRMLRMFDRVAIDFGNRHVDFHLKQGAMDSNAVRVASALNAVNRLPR
jgi:predicted aspartyl protease